MGKGMYMKQRKNPCINWRDPACCDYTNHFNRQDWAWEYLRINPEYRKEYNSQDKNCPANNHKNTSRGNIRIIHQKPSDLKAGEWGLLNFR